MGKLTDCWRWHSGQYQMHPFLGPASGGTEVRFTFTDQFPDRISAVWCRFGGLLEEPISWGYKPKVGVEVMCRSPQGIANTRVKAGISLNGVEFFPHSSKGQDFYFYREPVVTAVVPPKGDLRGGTRVQLLLAEDYLGNALATMNSPQHFQEAVDAMRCKFDGTVMPSEGVHMCRAPTGSGAMVPCVVCMSPPVSDVGQVQVKIALNTVSFGRRSAPFVYMDFFPVKTTRSSFGWRSLSDPLASNQAFVDENGKQIDPNEVPVRTESTLPQSTIVHAKAGLELALADFYGEFYGAVDTMSKETPPEYTFYDGMYSFYSTGYLGMDRAEVCVTAIRPSLGRAEGGTQVQLKVQGSIPFGHTDFYCIFHHTLDVVKASAVTYDSADDSIIMTCTTPAGTSGGMTHVGVSIDGVHASASGIPFYYIGDVGVSAISPSSVSSHGGIDITLTLSDPSPLPSEADESLVYPSCSFTYTSALGEVTIKESEGTYDSSGSYPTVACTTPGFSVDLPSEEVGVFVSLNSLDYGTVGATYSAVRYSLTVTSGDQIPSRDLYGLELFMDPVDTTSEVTYPELDLIEPAELSGAAYTEYSYSTARCMSYAQSSVATLYDLFVEGDVVYEDYTTEPYGVAVTPSVAPGQLYYTTELPYQVYNGFYISGSATDSYANLFLGGQAIPRGERSVLTAHDGTGTTQVGVTVLSSDSSTSLTYSVTVTRGAAGTVDTVDLVNITGSTGDMADISPTWSSTTYAGYSLRVRYIFSTWMLIEPFMTDGYASAIVTNNATSESETVGFNQAATAANFSLPVGITTVTITGVSEGGVESSTSIYEIVVERVSPQTVSTIDSVIITTAYADAPGSAVLSPSTWSPDTTEYSLTLLYEEDD
eukprot:scaffold14395_cov49-Prasinocladus_malaysianus.AAC.1